jgi:hypothetical protein
LKSTGPLDFKVTDPVGFRITGLVAFKATHCKKWFEKIQPFRALNAKTFHLVPFNLYRAIETDMRPVEISALPTWALEIPALPTSFDIPTSLYYKFSL